MIERFINRAVEELQRQEERTKSERQTYEEIISLCGKSMQLMHASKMSEAKKILSKVRTMLKKTDVEDGTVAQQEYVEAVALVTFMEGKRMKGYRELGVRPEAYLLGLADVLGELRREIVEHLRKDDYETASRLFEEMSNLYELLLPIRISNSFLPGFRRKLDVARSSVEQCRRDLLMYKISKNVKG